MPLFMLISGYLFAYSIDKYTWNNNIIKRIKTLFVPIIVWSFLTYIVNCYLNNEKSIISIKDYLHTAVYNLWFLWAVLICSIIVIIVNHFLNDCLYIYILGLILTFIIPDSYNLHVYKYVYPFFVLGYFFNKYEWKKLFYKLYNNLFTKCLCTIGYLVLLAFYRKDYYIYISGYCIIRDGPLLQLWRNVYRFAIGLFGSIVAIYIIIFLIKYIPKSVEKILIYIGKNTMGIYIISGYFFEYILLRITNNFHGVNYFYTILEAMCAIIVSLVLIRFIKLQKTMNAIMLGGRD